jgi:myo-inositol-1(or 4)-monophosphatase
MKKDLIPTDLSQLNALVKQVAREELLPRFNRVSRQYKHDGSPLTEADMACHHCLEDRLAEIWPDMGFLSEELDSRTQQEILENNKNGVWVVDPLDGTNNFANGIPYYCSSVALVTDQGPQLACVYDPTRDECFSAKRGEGAWLNGHRLSITNENTPTEHSLLFANISRLPRSLRERVMDDQPFGTARHFGASALDWCWLAMGRGHQSLHGGQNFWDYAAGELIFREAGGLCQTLNGEPVFSFSLEPRSVVAATNPVLFQHLRDLLE